MDFFDLSKIIVTKIFFTKASIDDIKTTEIKDMEVYFFISILLAINILQFFYYQDTNILKNLAINLIAFGGIGFLLYFTGQWGMGDSFLLLSLGLLNVFRNFFEIINWILITFSTGIIFIFIFSLIFVIVSKRNEKMPAISILSMISSLYLLFISLYFIQSMKFVEFLFSFLIFLYLSIPFLNYVKKLMIKRVSITELKEGDVLYDFKTWRGITKKEIMELKKKGVRYVYIKEGVRYAPTFLFVLIFLILEKLFQLTILTFFPQDFFLSL